MYYCEIYKFNQNIGIDVIKSNNFKDHLSKKVRFMPRLKNCGSSHSVNNINRSYDLTKDNSRSTNNLMGHFVDSETFSSYNPIDSRIKNNVSMSDFQRNLYKLN